jgi:hypothetical protein
LDIHSINSQLIPGVIGDIDQDQNKIMAVAAVSEIGVGLSPLISGLV